MFPPLARKVFSIYFYAGGACKVPGAFKTRMEKYSGRARNTLIVEAGAAAAADALSQLFREATYSMKQLRFPLFAGVVVLYMLSFWIVPADYADAVRRSVTGCLEKHRAPPSSCSWSRPRSAWVRDSRPAAAALSGVMRLLRRAASRGV